MKLAVLCTDAGHPVVPWLRRWASDMQALGHAVALCHDKAELSGGDMLFLVSCHQVLGEADRARFGVTLVLHASDLPRGRGWSPHVWSVLEGADHVTVSALEARDAVDSGPVWFTTRFDLEGHELLPEINARLFEAELALMTRAVRERASVVPVAQTGDPGPSRKRRTPEHSRLDVHRSIAEQFELLRVVDNERYPAFFEYRGKRYRIAIEKADDEA